ncbi:hypothetical protein [Variovorax sp. J22R203]|uniref:hypothetical protein n=1 Tax=Variovorax sp. J22R203 TaxID=3053512 RepID=UPI002574D7EF|nr:hypothetical protein [Variovorax sp. J22R203]
MISLVHFDSVLSIFGWSNFAGEKFRGVAGKLAAMWCCASPIRLPSMARWPQHCPASRAWGAATVSTRLLEETLTQLHSLLCYCHDHGHPAQEDAGPEHRNNVFWLASELARKAAELFQQCALRAGT